MATTVARNGGKSGQQNGPIHTLVGNIKNRIRREGNGSLKSVFVGGGASAPATPTPIVSEEDGGSGSKSGSCSTPATPTTCPGGIQRSGRSSSDKCRTPKKLCFREPEIISHSTSSLHKIGTIVESSSSLASVAQLPSSDSDLVSLGKKVAGSSGTEFGSVKIPKSSMRVKGKPDEADDLENQAMRIVRTVGQAFEVCHKLVGHAGEVDENEEVQDSETNLSSQLDSKGTTEGSSTSKQLQPEQLILPQQEVVVNNTGSSTSLVGGDGKAASSSSNTSTPPAAILATSLTPLHHNHGSSESVPRESATVKVNNKPKNLDLNRRDNISTNDLMNLTTPGSSAVPTPTQSHSFFKEIIANTNPTSSGSIGKLAAKVMEAGNKENLAQVHEAQLLKEQLEQQTQNTRAALAQIQLLRDQLAAESAARIEAQARTHQLLIHNKELLDHLQTLVRHIQELEAATSGTQQQGGKERSGNSNNSLAAATVTGVTLPQLTPRSKIERWFSFVVPPQSPNGDDDAEDNNPEDDISFLAADFESLDKAIRNLRLSRRTLLSNKESGFVSETNETSTRKSSARAGAPTKKKATGGREVVTKLSSRPQRHHHHPRESNLTGLRNGNRLSSTSSWLRRVLRLKRSSLSNEYRRKLKSDGEMWENDAHSTSTFRKRPTTLNSPSLRVNSNKSRQSSLLT